MIQKYVTFQELGYLSLTAVA